MYVFLYSTYSNCNITGEWVSDLCSIQTKGIQNVQNGNLQTFPLATARLVFVKGLLIINTVSSLMSFIKWRNSFYDKKGGAHFICGAVAVFERHPFCHWHRLKLYILFIMFKHFTPIPLLLKHSLFIVYMFFYVLKELRHLINDIKLDTVLTITKPLTKTSRGVARGKVWRFPFCTFCIPLVWMEHK